MYVRTLLREINRNARNLDMARRRCWACTRQRKRPNRPSPQVHSLDLVAYTPRVTACNMAATPLKTSSVDAAIFSLALMGTDYGSFLTEAHRVLKPRGWLWIAEVRSR